MTKVNIKENSWLAKLAARQLGTGAVAMVLGRTIHLFNVSKDEFLKSDTWVRHELKHVEQVQRYGLLPFLWRYAVESIRNGYDNNKYEIEARLAERDQAIASRYHIEGHTEASTIA